MEEMSLEVMMNRLEEITKILEKNESSLDEQIKLYKEALDIANICSKKLGEFEKQIQLIYEK